MRQQKQAVNMDEQERKKLKDEFYRHGGDQILKCIQCGTCSGSCPLTAQMDHAPREIFALIRDGEIEEALTSNTIWYCVSCYQCAVRCPKEIPVIDLIYELKRLAVKYKLVDPDIRIPHMYQAFSVLTGRFGRVTEPLVMAGYGLRHPLAVASNTVLALKLFKRKRLDILPQKMAASEK